MKHSIYTSYDELPLMLSVAEVAAVLGISRAGAYELVHGNEFPALKIGSRIVVPKDKFLAWIDANSGSKNAPLSRWLSVFFESTPSQGPKAAKCGVFDTRPGDVRERAVRVEGSDSGPVRKAPVSPCEPLCAIL